MPKSLDISTPQEQGTLQVSKSRKLPLLIDLEEMRSLLDFLQPMSIFSVGRPTSLEAAELSKEEFLKNYGNYIQGIKSGDLIDEAILAPIFSSVITSDISLLYAMPVAGEKYLVKMKRPVIQLQRHHFIFSDGKFHSGVKGEGSVTWGIQFSYPQMALDPITRAITKIDKSDRFPNTALFQRLSKWVRDHTSATPFLVEGERVNVPIRLGKKCFPWINSHPSLIANHLKVLDVHQTNS